MYALELAEFTIRVSFDPAANRECVMNCGLKSVLAGSCVALAVAWTSGAIAKDAPLSDTIGTVAQTGVQETAPANLILAQSKRNQRNQQDMESMQGQVSCLARDRAMKGQFQAMAANQGLAEQRALDKCMRNGGTTCFIASCR